MSDNPDWLHSGATIVTASARLARRLSWQFTSARLATGASAWESPDILPWNAWIGRLWEELRWSTGRTDAVLRSAQRRVLWQHIIESSPQRHHLLQPAAVANRAMDAWDNLHAFNLPIFPAGVFLNEDARAFRGWADAYRRRCVEDEWLDEAQLPALLARAVNDIPVRGARKVSLVGFDEPTPVARALAEALNGIGVEVVWQSPPRAVGRAIQAPFHDANAELLAAARWARRCLERDSACSIGIVVPGVSSQRVLVQDVFANVLTPLSLVKVPDGKQDVFSIAAGEPLTDQPLVAHALLILSLARERLPAIDAGALLRSPYLRGATAEAPARALLDAALRRRRDREIGIGAMLAEGKHAGGEGVADLLHGLGALQGRARALPAKQRAPDWARACSVLLKDAGWPGCRTLTSVEYQVLSAWRDVLADFVSLDGVTGAINFGTALRHLRRLAAERAFQPQTPEAPIQILDLAGAADMGFDHLWVTGMHEDAWPPTAQPNPFLPLPLQREAGMPRASAEAELARARRVTDSLLAACTDVVMSWPQQEGDTVLRPSPLIRTLDEEQPPLAEDARWVASVFSARRVSTFVDDAGPALAAGTEVRGGAALFKSQAACPFRAFAKHRLRADALEEVDVGLDAMERGTLVHSVLQQVWLTLGSQAELLKLSEAGIGALVDAVVEKIVGAAAQRRPQVFTMRFAAMERQRLGTLAREWLAEECRRAPFTVTGCEASRPFRLGGIAGQLRTDRIDTLPDGRQVILDYKTGHVPAKPWEGDRPEEPQLPLYAVTGAEPLAAVAFARVVRGEGAFKGIAAEPDLLPGVKSAAAWDELLAGWRGVLLNLAAQFERGHAQVDPRNGNVTCRNCDLHPFCRVHELGVAPEMDDGTDGDSHES